MSEIKDSIKVYKHPIIGKILIARSFTENGSPDVKIFVQTDDSSHFHTVQQVFKNCTEGRLSADKMFNSIDELIAFEFAESAIAVLASCSKLEKCTKIH